jgi:regulator of CtrA degradation
MTGAGNEETGPRQDGMAGAIFESQISDPSLEEGSMTARALGFVRSEVFRRAFSGGMAMVEETATYLDGPGRDESRTLARRAALAYAGESMRVTTRLMQVASWLLVQRSVAEGDISVDEVAKDKYRLTAREVCNGRKEEAEELLPERLVDLLHRSAQLYQRIDRLDQQIYGAEPAAAPKGARGQFDRLQSAFGAAFE